ncbi:DENN domain-containing protein 1A [Nerophis ophidion]|uniref:DENN domain-containing protein 1A n=1 Tax=Nerophis ophidion TaxID=159077 RepID=UPI002AE0AACE|nr:DENN domain-containing protein 1A [Nerophis ophidion]
MDSRIKESPEFAFEVYMEVVHPGTDKSEPDIRRKFPEDFNDEETIQTVPKFCFPFCLDSVRANQMDQNFTFVLTDINSKHRFGFCRLSSSANICHCVLSYLPWFDVFYKLLSIIADYTINGQDINFQELLVSLHTLSIPEPGVPVHLAMHFYFTVPDLKELPRIPEHRNLTEYSVAVDVNNMLHLYASMLYERRILICCNTLSTLTACVHGSAAMIYPMHWQHVYIPVLPQHLLDYCCAPMPYLIGVHSSLMEKVRGMAIEDVVVLNVDTNTLETPYNDLQSLPQDVVSSLKSRLKKFSTTPGDGMAQAFLKSQASLFGSYRNALRIESGEPITFNEEAFVNHRLSAMREFLQNAIHLQLFKQFIDGRLDRLNAGEGFSDLFEEEINKGEYAGSDKSYHQWLNTVKKGSGAILNSVKTKANPAMKTVYKFAKDHAKMGIKEVKSRLKQKEIADIGPGMGVGDNKKSEGAPSTWDDHRVNWHFGLTPSPTLLKKQTSNDSLESPDDQLQPYHSLKEVECVEERDCHVGPHTAPPSPPKENLSNVSLLASIFSCLDEHESPPFPLAKSLEDLRILQDCEALRAKFTCERKELSFTEYSQMFPGLKPSHPYNKLLSQGQDQADFPPCKLSSYERLQSAQFEKKTHSSQNSGLVARDSSTPDNITIPRPHARKRAGLGPPNTQPQCTQRNEYVTKRGGQEFRKALSKTSDEVHSLDGMEFIRLLDPLNESTHVSFLSGKAEGDNESTRSFPQNLPPFQPPHDMSSNLFSQSVWHKTPEPLSDSQVITPTISGRFRQQLPGSSTRLPIYPMASPSSYISLPHSSTANYTLSNLRSSMSVPSPVSSTLTRPFHAEVEKPNPQDLFGDLLTMIQPAVAPQKRADPKRWETFD